MKPARPLRFGLLCALAGCAWLPMADSSSASKTSLPLRQVGRGAYGGPVKPGLHVVRSPKQLQGLVSGARFGSVDFKREVVLLAAAGQQRTGGYMIEIKRVELSGKGKAAVLRVYYQQEGPPPDAMVTMAITQPWHAVAIPRVAPGGRTKFIRLRSATPKPASRMRPLPSAPTRGGSAKPNPGR